MTVDELLTLSSLEALSENQWKVDNLIIPSNWAQGRTAFGGISAGMAYSAIRQKVSEERVLRSFTTNFVNIIMV